MYKIIKLLFLIIFLATFSIGAYSETTWITKKDKSSKKIVKKTKSDTNQWIKKKEIKKAEVKENKKKFKKKIKDSKSWITKKSKEKINNIKKSLKKYKDIDKLPKADIYFAAVIEPKENEDSIYLYGYINSDTKSKKFKFKNKSYHTNSDGIAFLDDGKTTCNVDSKSAEFLGDMMGKVIVKCSNKLGVSGKFVQVNNIGKGIEGETNQGNNVEFEFYSSKDKAIAKLKHYKENNKTLITRTLPSPRNNKNIKLEPNGKYYALLIGNSKYDNWDNLVSPVNDVKEINKILSESFKFEKIITVLNGSKKEILNGFKELSSITTSNDYVLIYYAGHGETKAERAYWVPKDGSKDWGNDDWIDINYLDIYLTEIKAHHLAVLVDSCYVGSKFKGVNVLDMMNEDDSKILASILDDNLNARSRSVLSSGSNGPVKDTIKGGDHSMFGSIFISMLTQFEKMTVPVTLKTIAWNMDSYFAGSGQRPHYYHPPTWDDGGGDFIFIPKKNLK